MGLDAFENYLLSLYWLLGRLHLGEHRLLLLCHNSWVAAWVNHAQPFTRSVDPQK